MQRRSYSINELRRSYNSKPRPNSRPPKAFQRHAEREDAKVDKLLQAETPERRPAIMQEAVAILREDGLDDAQIEFMWKNDLTFRSATAQKMLMREAKSRIAERGIRAAGPPVPHVSGPE